MKPFTEYTLGDLAAPGLLADLDELVTDAARLSQILGNLGYDSATNPWVTQVPGEVWLLTGKVMGLAAKLNRLPAGQPTGEGGAS